jgi:hypothetical protein
MPQVAVGNEGALNGATPVVVVAAPGASTQRVVRTISVHNRDSAAVTITLNKIKAASTYRINKIINLGVDGTWSPVNDAVMATLDATDETIEMVMSGAPATANPDFHITALDNS